MYVTVPNVFYTDKYRKMVDGARAVHTAQGKHVRKSGEGNSLPEMGELTRLLIDANRDSPSFSGIPGARHAETMIGNYHCNLYQLMNDKEMFVKTITKCRKANLILRK